MLRTSRPFRILSTAVIASGIAAASVGVDARAGHAADPVTPRVGHVWIFVFENTNYDQVTTATMPYFSARAAQGVTLSKMYGVGHASLTNYIAMASGHAPKPSTQADCFNYDCIYEAGEDANVADQLEEANFTWKAYMDGAPGPCPKPQEKAGEPYIVGYATRHNPFMYYRGLVDDKARCVDHVRTLADLAGDRAAGNVANYNFISPDTCNDAHDDSKDGCKLPDADKWLEQHLKPILDSPEYKSDGAVILTFDEAEISDASNCCDPKTPGGGHIATAILSPRLAKPGTIDATPYSHYSLLRTVEDNFGLAALRHAGDASTNSMITLFKAPDPSLTTTTPNAAGSTTIAARTTTQTVVKPKKKSSDSQSTLWFGLGLGLAIVAGGVISAKRRSAKLKLGS